MNTINEQFQVLMTQTTFPPHFFLLMLLGLLAIVMLSNALFAYSVYKTARLIEKTDRRFPLWFVWLFVIPGINLIFQILLLVFDIPRGLKLTFSQSSEITQKAQGLFSLGMAFLIVTILAWILSGVTSFFLTCTSLILLAIYWVKVVAIRKRCEQLNLVHK